MGRIVSVVVAAVAVLWLVNASSAQMGGGMGGGMGTGGMGGGMGGSMGGMMGGGHMGAGGHMGSGMMGGNTGQRATPEITAEKAEQAAKEYATQNLPGFVVKRTIPVTGMHMTMYQAELSGPAGETRILHINPWGDVMPFGGPTKQ